MIYDISKYSLKSLMDDQRLVSSLMSKDATLTQAEAMEKIKIAYHACEYYRKPEPVKSNDHQPCQECGSTEFMRTGTCFACLTCGASQGCS